MLKPAFVVITGDLINAVHDPAQIAEFKRIAGKLDKSIPLYKVPSVIQELLGHAKISTTELYTRRRVSNSSLLF